MSQHAPGCPAFRFPNYDCTCGARVGWRFDNPEPPPAPEATIDCPACGVTVTQVASATLSLALWQHWNWACSKRPAPEATRAEREAFRAGFMAHPEAEAPVFKWVFDAETCAAADREQSAWEVYRSLPPAYTGAAPARKIEDLSAEHVSDIVELVREVAKERTRAEQAEAERDALKAALKEIARLRLATDEGSLRVRADRIWDICRGCFVGKKSECQCQRETDVAC